jgi:hypothetical protein
MIVMISANDALQLISEIHQYSILLLELRDAITFGIWHYPKEKVNYFKFDGKLGRGERLALAQKIYGGNIPDRLVLLPVDEFLRGIDGKKTRHIWFETLEPERKELAFLSIAELKAFLKSWKSQ